jgi:hypothetical protein
MAKEALIIGAMGLIALLVVAKSDKQFVNMLEGKLYKHDCDTNLAAPVYQKHKKILAVVFFVLSGAGIGLSVILLAKGNRLFPLAALLSAILLGVGIWGRIRSFLAADRELDKAASESRGGVKPKRNTANQLIERPPPASQRPR